MAPVDSPPRLQAARLARAGVDSSATAVEMTRQRGGTAIHRDVFAPLPAEGSWAQVLLTDGNIGIGGDPVQTLRRAAALLAHGGIVVVEIDSPATRFLLRVADAGRPSTIWGTGFRGHASGRQR